MANTNRAISIPPPVLENLANLGLRIAFARKIQKLRQDDVAGMTGVSRSTLVEIEKGSPFVSMGNYLTVLWALGLMHEITPTDLSDGERRLLASELPKRVRHAR